MNQGQIIGPAMLLNVIMRWPRAAPVALCALAASTYSASIARAIHPILRMMSLI